jgi:hypothetical protein
MDGRKGKPRKNGKKYRLLIPYMTENEKSDTVYKNMK